MHIVIPLFDRFTALDAVGPYEVLSRLPGAKVTFAATEAGPCTTDTGMLTISAEAALADVPRPEVLVVPGGMGTPEALEDERARELDPHRPRDLARGPRPCAPARCCSPRRACSTALDATTHWLDMRRPRQRWARSRSRSAWWSVGKVITAAGVSSGIDMALTLVAQITNDVVAQAIQLGIEYDPQPPFDAGSPDKAPADVLALVRAAERRATLSAPPAWPERLPQSAGVRRLLLPALLAVVALPRFPRPRRPPAARCSARRRTRARMRRSWSATR